MNRWMITGTQDPAGHSHPSPVVLGRIMATYRAAQGSPLQEKQVDGPLTEVDWAALWAEVPLHSPLLLIYPGSLGDPISDRLTVADWCHDWRLSVVLTLPTGASPLAQAAAYCGLARQAQTVVQGIVLFHPPTETISEALTQRIPRLTGVPVLGELPASDLEEISIQRQVHLGSQLDWEVLGY